MIMLYKGPYTLYAHYIYIYTSFNLAPNDCLDSTILLKSFFDLQGDEHGLDITTNVATRQI